MANSQMLEEQLEGYRNSPDSSVGFAKVFVHEDSSSALVVDWRSHTVIERFPDVASGWDQAEEFARAYHLANS